VKEGDRAIVVRSHRFAYRSNNGHNTLHCEQLSLSALARKFGTPLYVYSSGMIRERVHTFDYALSEVPHTICYSVKANSNLSILALIAKLGSGFDVVSGGELERVLRASRTAVRKTVFSGVGKTREEIQLALRCGILLFNVESESELDCLAKSAEHEKKIAALAFRVNPDVPAKTHPYISTGLRKHKFGVPINQARRLYRKAAASRWLKPVGVSVHIGSQICDVAPFALTMKRVADLVQKLRADGHNIQFVDAGGGLGIDYRNGANNDFAKGAASYANALLRPLRDLRVHLLLEPGRAIAGPAGMLLTKLIYKKRNGGKTFLVMDGAMNDLVRPSLYDAYHEIVPVEQRARRMEKVDVVGPICETGDFLARDRRLPITEEGELLAVLDVGAYGMVLASNYNTRPRPAEVLVDGRSVKLIRRREKIRDLVRSEVQK